MLITSSENKKIKDLQKLHIKKYRDETGLFLVEGKNLVEEAYKVGSLKELILEENESFKLDVETTYVTSQLINNLSLLETSSNIIGVCIKKESSTIGDKVLILDGIQDPGNLGTIIRSAVAFNIDTLIISDDTVDIYNDKCLRACQGMIFQINIIRTNLESFIPKLRENSYRIYGTIVYGGNDVKEATVPSKYALIMGNEGNGLSENVINLCDELITIKMNNDCESLNVAIACSIIMYQINK